MNDAFKDALKSPNTNARLLEFMGLRAARLETWQLENKTLYPGYAEGTSMHFVRHGQRPHGHDCQAITLIGFDCNILIYTVLAQHVRACSWACSFYPVCLNLKVAVPRPAQPTRSKEAAASAT